MTQIRPFCGLRPVPEYAAEIAALPYDVMDTEEARQILNKNPLSFLRVTKSEATMSDCIDPHSQAVYKMAKTNLDRYLSDGQMKKDTTPCYYIYRQQMGQHIQIGLVAAASVEEYRENIIKKHELTRHDKEQDRVNHILATEAQTGAVFLTYKGKPEINTYVLSLMGAKKPVYDFTSEDGVQHTLYVVENLMEIAELTRLFEDVPVMYIADGHHRYETALNFRNYCREQGLAKEGDPADYIMMMLVDMEHDGLVVFPTHRLLRNLKNFDPRAAMKACEPYFRVEEKACVAQMEKALDEKYAKGEKAFGFYCGGDRWTLLTLKDLSVLDGLLPGLSEASKSLDVTVLHTLVLEKLFGIDKENMANQVNLTYTRSFQEAVESVEKGESQCAFILNPTRVAEIRDVAAAGEKMPQKSTYFYPKLITGLVMNPLK